MEAPRNALDLILAVWKHLVPHWEGNILKPMRLTGIN